MGHRHDLIAKAEEMGSVLWPQWNLMVVQLKKRETQSYRIKPHYAVVIAPVRDVSHEPIVLALPKVSGKIAAEQCLNLRCTELNCPYRLKALDPDEASKVGKNDEVKEDDRVNLLDCMLEESQEIEAGAAADEVDEAGDDAEGATKRRDCMEPLWPYAHTTMYYREMFSQLATADKASVCCLLFSTAHPSHWIVCAHDFSLSTYVHTQRWSDHSQQHGHNLGSQLLLRIFRR